MFRHARSTIAGICLATAGAVAFTLLSPASRAADDKAKGHAHDAAMKELVQMLKGDQGAAMIKEMMMKMAVHQHMVGEMAQDPDVKQLAQSPEMKRVLQEVKASIQEHATVDAKKAEVAKDNREAMMVLAHALMMQDRGLKQELEKAEKGKE